MDINDLAELLHGANITINVQGGHNNTMHTGPEQHNHYSAAQRRESRCSICGESSGGDLYGHAFGTFTHQHCLEEQGRIAREKKVARSAEFGRSMQQIAAWHRSENEPTPEQRSRWYQPLVPGQEYRPPAQIAAPEPEQLIIIDEPRQRRYEVGARYAGDYEQLQRNRAACIDAEFDRINRSLIETDDYRIVKPLSPEMHTHTPDPILTDREARQQAEWNLLYGR